MAKAAADKGNKTLILSDRTKLMNQNAGAFEKFGLNPTFINPQTKTISMDSNATSGMLQTLRRRIHLPEVQEFIKTRDLVIIDEAHLATSDYLFESGLLDDVRVIGATATSLRSGNQTQLGMLYDEIVQGEQVRYFVENGWLMPDVYYGVDCGDVSQVPFDYKTGDYQGYGMYKHFDKKEKYQGVLDNYMTHSPNSKTICFSSNQTHAVKTALEFERAGIPVMFLTSGLAMPKKPDEFKNNGERVQYEEKMEDYMFVKQYSYLTGKYNDVISGFENNKFKVLVNVNQLTAGVDIPDVESIILNRYTISLPLYIQSLGRGSRPSPETGKINFKVFDFGNSAARKENNLGFYMDDRRWGLWHETGKNSGVAATKICDPYTEDKNKKRGCSRLIHISLQMCPFCGKLFESEKEAKQRILEQIAYGNQVPEEVLISTMGYKQLHAHMKLKNINQGGSEGFYMQEEGMMRFIRV